MQRRPTPELLDTDSGTPAEIAGSISDLRLINRWFGGVATTRALVQTVARKTGKSEFSLLEVAAGDGSLAKDVRASLQPLGIRLNLTLLDRAPSHLPQCPNSNNNNSNNKKSLSSRAQPGDSLRESPGAVEGPASAGSRLVADAFDVGVGVDLQTQGQKQKRRTRMSDPHEQSALVADALNLPFPDSTFDLISSCLFVHHLSPDQATAFAKESLRVCRYAVLVNDLIRHPLHLALIYAGMPLYRSRLTRHDAPASVRQAYTIKEMKDFFQQSGAASVETQRHYLYRMGVIAWKAKGKPAT